MSNGPSDIRIKFAVEGAALSSYIDLIQKKSDQLTNSQIMSARSQAEAGKGQLKIISEQIQQLERKSRIETQAGRSLIADKRSTALYINSQSYDKAKERVFQMNLPENVKREKIMALEGSEAAKANKITNEAKESLAVLREQERQSKLLSQLSRENIDTIRQTARENVKAVMGGSIKLGDIIKDSGTEEKKLISALTAEGVKDEQKRQKRESYGKSESLLGSLLAVNNLNKIATVSGQFVSSQNGFDLIQPASNMAGRVIGGIIGGLVGSLAGGVGAVAGAAFGAELGGDFGDTLGAYEKREALSKQNFFGARNKYAALTGSNTDSMGMFDLSNVGINATQGLQLQSEYARKRGYSSSSAKDVRDAAYIDKAFGVDPQITAGLIEMQRSMASSNRDLAGLIGGVLQKGKGDIFSGGDQTFLPELLTNMTRLSKEMLKTSSSVPTGTALDIIRKFDAVGGEFSARDPRQMGLISTINGALSSPSTDMTRALSFYALKKAHPNMSLSELIAEQQKGIRSKDYLNDMMGLVDSMGGSDDARKLNTAGLLGLSSQQAFASDLYRGYKEGRFKNGFSQEQLNAIPSDLKTRAEANTTDLERNTANVENGILSGQAVEKMADAFVAATKAMLGGAVIELNNGQGKIKLVPSGQIRANQIKTNTSPPVLSDMDRVMGLSSE